MTAAVAPGGLLDGEDDPVIIVNGQGRSPIMLACEHAGRRIPKRLESLGLRPEDLRRHNAYYIG